MKCCLDKECKKVHIRGCTRSQQTNTAPTAKPTTQKSKVTFAQSNSHTQGHSSSNSGATNQQKSYSAAARMNLPVAQKPNRDRSDSTSSQSSKFQNKPSLSSENRRPNPQHNNQDFQKHLESIKADIQKMVSESVTTSLRALFPVQSPQYFNHQQWALPQQNQQLIQPGVFLKT